jgi:Tetratricopeptide repeat
LSTIGLSTQAAHGLQAASVLLRETHGFMFLPLLVESERAASAALAYLQAPLAQQFYSVAWPASKQPGELLANLDDAITKLPQNSVVVLDASSSVRHALALQAVAYLNLRREPLRTAQLRFVLFWPSALKDDLLSNAPDLWSMRATSPWVTEADLVFSDYGRSNSNIEQRNINISASGQLSATSKEQLSRWEKYRSLQAADLSARDALALAEDLHSVQKWAASVDLAEAVVHATGLSNQSSAYDLLLAAKALVLQSLARKQLGNLPAALAAAQRSTQILRDLTAANPAAFEPDLAMSVNNLASFFGENGDRQGALLAAREAVDIYRRLASANPVVFEPDLAMSLSNLAKNLSDNGDRPGALVVAQESVDLSRRLARADQRAFESDLATSVNNLASFLSESGDRSGAMVAAHESVDIRRRLARTNPAAFEPALAGSLNNLANRLRESGDRPGALLTASEAVDMHRRLARTNPAAFEPNLAMSVSNLANYLSESGDHAGALLAAQEAVDIYKRLARANPAAFEPELAGSLNNLANRLGESGDRPGALLTAREVVDSYRRLARADPVAFEADLAMGLGTLMICLAHDLKVSEARQVGQEALARYEQLNKQHAGVFEDEVLQTQKILQTIHKE